MTRSEKICRNVVYGWLIFMSLIGIHAAILLEKDFQFFSKLFVLLLKM